MVNVTKDQKSFFEDKKYPYFIYGCTLLGKHLVRFMKKCDMQLIGVIDQYRQASGKLFYGVPIICPDEIDKIIDTPVYNIIVTVKDAKSVLLYFWNMDQKYIYNMLLPKQYSDGSYNNNLLLSPLRRRLLNTENITLISNNCCSQTIYAAIGMTEREICPLSLAGFDEEEFLKLAGNLRYYMKQKLEYDSQEYRGVRWQKDVVVMGRLGDIKLQFRHETCWEEAERKWERLKDNMYYDNVFWILSDFQRSLEYSYVKAFSELGINKCIQLSKTMYHLPGINYTRDGAVGDFFDGSVIIEEWFDLLGWLNGEYVFDIGKERRHYGREDIENFETEQ